ncbi:MAG: LysM peptidoglycan-binding domain-containing protein [Sulfitobacter sp.]
MTAIEWPGGFDPRDQRDVLRYVPEALHFVSAPPEHAVQQAAAPSSLRVFFENLAEVCYVIWHEGPSIVMQPRVLALGLGVAAMIGGAVFLSSGDGAEQASVTRAAQADLLSVARRPQARPEGLAQVASAADTNAPLQQVLLRAVPTRPAQPQMDVLPQFGETAQRLASAPVQNDAVAPIPLGETQEYEVQRGDSLASIALAFYGDAAGFTRIFEANRDRLHAPSNLEIGMRLTIPASAQDG